MAENVKEVLGGKMDMNQSDRFEYSYSSKRQEEIKTIRDKYIEKNNDKMEQLQKLDRSVTAKATMAAIITGLFGTLIMGAGMSCCMVWPEALMIPGIIIGIIGMAGIALAYPMYNHVLIKERARVAPDILKLSEELLK